MIKSHTARGLRASPQAFAPSLKVTEFERRQLAAVQKELDQEYEAASRQGRQRIMLTLDYPATLGLDPLRVVARMG